MESLRLSYTQRINRPGIAYLSPYEQWTTPESVQSGNPDLQAEVTHQIVAAYSIFKGVFNLNLQWLASISTNAISPLTFIDTQTGVSRTTYGNIANEQFYGISAYISGQPSPKFNYYINLQPAYKKFSAPGLGMKDARFGGSMFGGFNWTAWKNGTMSVNAGAGLPDGHLQLDSKLMWYYYGLSVTQRFFDDKLKVSLSASNMFNKYNKYQVVSIGDGFKSISEGGQRSQHLNISVTYTFGKLKAQVKKANRSIVNDDIVGGSSEGMGSGQGNM
jgi:outer membrane receptor protein involved in Fe transport